MKPLAITVIGREEIRSAPDLESLTRRMLDLKKAHERAQDRLDKVYGSPGSTEMDILRAEEEAIPLTRRYREARDAWQRLTGGRLPPE
jgi:hypothetical protein